MGRGCLDGSLHTSWDERIFGIYFERSSNISIEGIGIRENFWWVTHFLLCTNVKITDINLFSFYRNNGGLMMDGCTDYSAKNSIILTNDDCICPHALNGAGNGEPAASAYLFENLVLYNVLSGNGIRIGASFETAHVHNWTFKNIDVLAHTAGSALFADHSDWAKVENIRFVNFYDEQAYHPTIKFVIDSTKYSCFTGYKNRRGSMETVVFSNLRTPGGDIILHGFDQNHRIDSVYFINSYVGSDQIDGREDIVVNDFVGEVFFDQQEPTYHLDDTFLLVSPSCPDSLIIDNTSHLFLGVGFETVGGEEGYWSDDFAIATVPQGFSNFKAAIFQPKIEGQYHVSIHWGKTQELATNARWLVHHADGFSTKYFDQNNTPGWHYHGNYRFSGSSYVRLLLPGYFQVTDGPVVADAVRFVLVK